MFTYISGSSGHCYIHLDSLFILTLLEKRIKCKKSSLKKTKWGYLCKADFNTERKKSLNRLTKREKICSIK